MVALSNHTYKSGNLDKFFKEFAQWLGYDGTAFVVMLREEYGFGWGTACWNTGPPNMRIPHSVHFREGMQIRNYMRGWKLFQEMGWGAHEFDNMWPWYTEIAVEYCLRIRL